MSFVDIVDGAWTAGILFRNYIVLNDAVTFQLRLQLAPSRGCSNVRREYYRERKKRSLFVEKATKAKNPAPFRICLG